MKRHMKRFSAPKHWKLESKTHTFAVKPVPGPHPTEQGIPLLGIVRDFLGYAQNGKEARRVIENGEVLVDHQTRKEPKYAAGVMDVISIPKTEEDFRLVPGEKGLRMQPIPKSKSDFKLVRIMGKTMIRGGKLQVNLHDGSNIEVDPSESGEYSVGDVLEMTIRARKIKDKMSIKPGNMAYVYKGRNTGKLGRIEKTIKGKAMQPNTVIMTVNDSELHTLEDYVLVVGRESPKIKVN